MKEKSNRWQYVGFDDRVFMMVGIIVLASTTTFLFNSTFNSTADLIISFCVSLLFTTTNWLVLRWIMIQLRKRYPSISESAKRNIIYLTCIIAVVVGVNALVNLLLRVVLGPQFNGGGIEIKIIVLLISIMTMATYEAIYYLQKLKAFIVKEEKTRQAVTQSQLDALRNQARPHFLFNSLNTLRDIIETDTKAEAKSFVDHIADVYRFILDSGQDNVVSLSREIDFAKSYLHIQAERFGDNLQVNWHVHDDALRAKVIPMSLQLLLENAIKHNIVSAKRPLQIDISSSELALTVSNNLQPKTSNLPSTGLGLENIKKRYSLVSMPEPIIDRTDSHFSVSIPLIK